jgi:putative redox protein
MSVRIDVRYDGSFHCTSTHEPSGTELATDAPKDNQGLGESFSPTDLVATALGTCMLTTVAIFAKKDGIEMQGASAIVHKEMVADPKRRIGKLTVEITMPVQLDDAARAKYEQIAHACPVAQSLAERTQVVTTFAYV